MKLCHNCGEEWIEDFKPGFNDRCEKCDADLHVCKNCKFYDRSMSNNCAEPVAERVPDDEKNNFCPFFEFKETTEEDLNQSDSAELKKAFDNLFN